MFYRIVALKSFAKFMRKRFFFCSLFYVNIEISQWLNIFTLKTEFNLSQALQTSISSYQDFRAVKGIARVIHFNKKILSIWYYHFNITELFDFCFIHFWLNRSWHLCVLMIFKGEKILYVTCKDLVFWVTKYQKFYLRSIFSKIFDFYRIILLIRMVL